VPLRAALPASQAGDRLAVIAENIFTRCSLYQFSLILELSAI
jgi:hypothetical protein